MTDTQPDLDLTALEAWANKEAKAQTDAGWGEGSTYEDRLANNRRDARRLAGLPEESTYQTDDRRSGLVFHDEPTR